MFAGNDNIHKSLDEFEIQSDLIRDHSWLLSSIKKIDVAPFLAHLSRRLIGELIVYTGIRRPSVNIFKRHLL